MRITMPGVAVLLLLGGCAAPTPGFPVTPALPAETIPLPPVSEEELIWQPGDWAYFGGSYRYEAGRYVPRAGRAAAWTFGHWTGAHEHSVWVPGGWN